MIVEARLDEINCWAHTTATTPPIKIESPHIAFRFISVKAGNGSFLLIQKINSAIPAINKRSEDNKNGGKLFSARCTPKKVEPQMI